MPRPLRRLPHPLTTLENCHDADDTFLLSVFPQIRFHALSGLARLRSLARPAGQGLLLAALLLFLAGTAQAAGSSMPWEGPLQSILESIQGPVARIVAVIIIIATGLALAFGDTSGGFRKLIQIVFGLSIAFAASSFFLSFFSFSGGAVV
jgi:type IV secretory pathway VirB2 component (pilin)